jgi:hypothetical protein
MLADHGWDVHDEKVVQTLKVHAIAEMARKRAKITAAQSKAAIGILPKVGNLRTGQNQYLICLTDCKDGA